MSHAHRKTTPEQRRRWDLSNLQFVMSGAEPIRAETMAAFFEAFAPCGLKPSVFCSAYGLAEHVCGAFPPPACTPPPPAWTCLIHPTRRECLAVTSALTWCYVSADTANLAPTGATTWGTNQLTVDRRSLEAAGRVRPAQVCQPSISRAGACLPD